MVLNLDPNFKPIPGFQVDFLKFKFPGGEPHIKLNINFKSFIETKSVTITTRIKNMDDLMWVLLVTDALKNEGINDIALLIPYLPFARQDRKMIEGEPFSLKVLANILNAQNYSNVIIYDVHSEASTILINNSINISNHSFVYSILEKAVNPFRLICPDAGAYKKFYSLMKHLRYKGDVVLCNKIRNVSTGKIEKTKVYIDEEDKGYEYYIVDDICDGGATYIGIAKEMHNINPNFKINLIVSHGIFSKGYENLLLNGIDKIYTTDSVEQKETPAEFKERIFITNLRDLI